MRTCTFLIAVLAAFASGSLSAGAQRIDFAKIAIRAETLAPNIYALTGSTHADPAILMPRAAESSR